MDISDEDNSQDNDGNSRFEYDKFGRVIIKKGFYNQILEKIRNYILVNRADDEKFKKHMEEIVRSDVVFYLNTNYHELLEHEVVIREEDRKKEKKRILNSFLGVDIAGTESHNLVYMLSNEILNC